MDDLAESAIATKAYIEAVRAIAENRLGATVSVKLSQLGIGLDPAVVRRPPRRTAAGGGRGRRAGRGRHGAQLGRPGDARGVPCRAARTPPTSGSRSRPRCGGRRSDLESFTDVKPRIRLVKGAFLEPIEKALQERQEITAQYRYLADWALANLPDPAFGTHDDACIDHVKSSAERLGIDRRDFEFQMLYGVRRDVQRRLADEGYRIRIYLPYGTQWYPYLMRRMAERPANLLLFLRSLVSG